LNDWKKIDLKLPVQNSGEQLEIKEKQVAFNES